MKINQLIPSLNATKIALTKQHQPLVSLHDIEVVFNNQKALHNINLSIYPNSITTIVGPNGGGKSTLLKYC